MIQSVNAELGSGEGSSWLEPTRTEPIRALVGSSYVQFPLAQLALLHRFTSTAVKRIIAHSSIRLSRALELSPTVLFNILNEELVRVSRNISDCYSYRKINALVLQWSFCGFTRVATIQELRVEESIQWAFFQKNREVATLFLRNRFIPK